MKKFGGFLCAFLALGLVSIPLAAYDNSPSNYQCVPECIWAPASAGGTWVTEIQIITWTAGSVVSCYFDYGTNFKYVHNLYTLADKGDYVRFSNILYSLDFLDTTVFDYYGRVGAVEFFTQGTDYKIQVTARTVNGNFGKTFPGLNKVDSNLARTGNYAMVIPFVSKTTTYRSTIGMFNPTGSSVTAQIYIMDQNYSYYDTYELVFPGYNFKAHDPFAYAGMTSSYSHLYILVWPTSGTGNLFCFGATSNNITNDPSTLIAQQMN